MVIDIFYVEDFAMCWIFIFDVICETLLLNNITYVGSLLIKINSMNEHI